jgi:Ferredoxin-like domain in Api92-like protein
MPNWVYNRVTVEGNQHELQEFVDKARKQNETRWLSESWIRNEDGTNTKVEDKDRKIEVELSEPADLSFWNFIAPPEEILDEYFGIVGFVEGVGFTDEKSDNNPDGSNGWYGWNTTNWGTKWNARDVDLEQSENEAIYTFSTAWSIPEPIFRAMAGQHPTLTFTMGCEEEQGWGAEYSAKDGELYLDKEWDIPTSHADYVAKGDEDGCACGRYEDEDDNWYEDCPRDVNEFLLVITKTYKVRTDTAENAWALVQENGNDPDELMEFVEGSMNSYVVDENGKRIYPTLDN